MAKIQQLTKRQQEVLTVLRERQRSLRRAPVQRDVAEKLGIARRTACYHIANLADKGAVVKYGHCNHVKFYDLKA